MAAVFFLLAWTYGCSSDSPIEPDQAVTGQSASTAYSALQMSGLVTSDPATFAAALRSIANENEVLVMLKNPGVAAIDPDFLRSLDTGAPVVVATPLAVPGTERRSTPGLARSGDESRATVSQAIAQYGLTPYASDANALALRIPDDKLLEVLSVLLGQPGVDYIEANQKRPILLDGGPLGSNLHDIKHTFHNILDAWDYTRGAGAIVGILDSGYAWDAGSSQWHPDGQLIDPGQGISKNGFVDDYDNYINCDGNDSQPYGGCVTWDDQGHGTGMAGLVGANDNDIGVVGVMPQGLTVSMKAVTNCYIASGCGNADDYVLEDDDFYWGVRWASHNDVGVLSMSFSSTGFGTSVYNALYDAYYTYDVLPLSSTGNTGDPSDQVYPQAWPFVMGVGGLNSDGSNYGKDGYQDVSGLAGGTTTRAYCPSDYSFCTPGTYGSSSGTSAAAAIVAGIAGLVRAYSPGLTAAQVWQRLVSTSTGPHEKVDALAAVLNQVPLSAFIDGPTFVQANTTHTWDASVSGGVPPYSYTWYRDGSQVSSASSYTGSSGSADFNLQLDVTDAASATATTSHYVTVNQCPPPQIQC